MRPQDINIDHWPPTYHDISDAFASIEKYRQRVEHIYLYESDLPQAQPNTLSQDGIDLWGAELHYLPGESNGTMRFVGGTMGTSLLGPRA